MELAPMLLTAASAIPATGDFAYEPKWDGMRTLLHVSPSLATSIESRRGVRWTAAFPELACIGQMVGRSAVLDGETIVMGPDGRPDFAALSRRLHGRCGADARPATFVAFDVLALDDEALVGRPWSERRAVLDSLGLDGVRAIPTMVADDGDALFAATGELGVEGVVAKRRTSRYLCGRRSSAWLKVKHRHSGWFDVDGWRLASRSVPTGGLVLSDQGAPAGTAISALPGYQREAFHRFAERHGTLAGDVVQLPRAVQVRVDYLERSATGLLREGVAREVGAAPP